MDMVVILIGQLETSQGIMEEFRSKDRVPTAKQTTSKNL